MALKIEFPLTATFIHIPKTGGTSVSAWLRKNFLVTGLGRTHSSYQQIKTYGDLGFLFAVIRNPWDWVVSAFNHDRSLIRKDNPADNGLEWYINNRSLLYIPQSDYISADTFLIRFENLEKEFRCIQEKFNCWDSLPKLNSYAHQHYTEFYNDKLKDLVYKKYKTDKIKYNYSFGD